MKDMYPNPTQRTQSVKVEFLKIVGSRSGCVAMVSQMLKRIRQMMPRKSMRRTL